MLRNKNKEHHESNNVLETFKGNLEKERSNAATTVKELLRKCKQVELDRSAQMQKLQNELKVKEKHCLRLSNHISQLVNDRKGSIGIARTQNILREACVDAEVTRLIGENKEKSEYIKILEGQEKRQKDHNMFLSEKLERLTKWKECIIADPSKVNDVICTVEKKERPESKLETSRNTHINKIEDDVEMDTHESVTKHILYNDKFRPDKVFAPGRVRSVQEEMKRWMATDTLW